MRLHMGVPNVGLTVGPRGYIVSISTIEMHFQIHLVLYKEDTISSSRLHLIKIIKPEGMKVIWGLEAVIY